MNRDEVKDLFKFIKSVYPNFDVQSEKIDTWARIMKNMDLERVMIKAEQHTVESRFPPTIAEVAAYAPAPNEHLEKMKQWKKEAAQVKPETKARFAEAMQQLFKDKIK